jgi:hypothetical protein
MELFKRRRVEFEEAIGDLESRLKDRGISIDEEYLSPRFIKSLVYFLVPWDYGYCEGREEVVKLFRKTRKSPGFDIEVATERELKDRFGGNTESDRSNLYVSRLNNGRRVRAIKVGRKPNVNYQEDLAAYKQWRDRYKSEEYKVYVKVDRFRAKQFACVYCDGHGGGSESIYGVPEPGEYQTCYECSGSGKVDKPNFSDDEFRIYEKFFKEEGNCPVLPEESWSAFLLVK